MTDLQKTVQRLSAPLIPRETNVKPALTPMDGIKVVLVDIYGTVLISGSGDVGTISAYQPAVEFSKALESHGIHCDESTAKKGPAFLKDNILQAQQILKLQGVDVPEVNILKIWEDLLGAWFPDVTSNVYESIALSYECRVNPVWPMPHVQPVLSLIKDSQLALGIVSNAQFYTPIILESLLEASLLELGFDESLCSWSWMESRAKPSIQMFTKPLEYLKKNQGIHPHEVVYIGNDMLNDVWTARESGCRTILFAGDNRSLRLREQDERCADLHPDAIITDWNQLPEVIAL